MNLQAQRAPRNRCDVMTVKSRGQGWHSTICKYLRIFFFQSSRTCGKKLNLAEEAPVLDLKTAVLVLGSMSTTITAAVHLGHLYINFSPNGNIFASCTLSKKKHAQTQVFRRFSLEISSGTMLRVESATLSRCCRLVVFLAEDPQVITTSHDRHH